MISIRCYYLVSFIVTLNGAAHYMATIGANKVSNTNTHKIKYRSNKLLNKGTFLIFKRALMNT